MDYYLIFYSQDLLGIPLDYKIPLDSNPSNRSEMRKVLQQRNSLQIQKVFFMISYTCKQCILTRRVSTICATAHQQVLFYDLYHFIFWSNIHNITTRDDILEAFGLCVHVYKFTFFVFFVFFFFQHLLTLGDNFYCYEQCIHCSHTVHTLFTY